MEEKWHKPQRCSCGFSGTLALHWQVPHNQWEQEENRWSVVEKEVGSADQTSI